MAMRKSRWRAELDAATSEKEVLNTAKDYVAFLARGEVAQLPKNFKLGPLETCMDVTDLALRLVQASLRFDSQSEGLRVLNNMSEFFSAASERFTELGVTQKDSSSP
jgi:hypothetical protein